MLATGTSSLAHDLYRGTAHILGQDVARKQLAVLLERQDMVRRGVLAQSSGAILAGRTGTGKTYLARTMCQLSGLPFAEVNAAAFTERGYVGMDLPQMFLPLLSAAAKQYDAERGEMGDSDVLKRDDLPAIKGLAQHGVILLDEFDKWLHRRNHVTGQRDTAVQAEILKMIEGSTEYVSDDADEVGTEFDSTCVLIICGGAFVGLIERVKKRLSVDMPRGASEESFWEQIEPSDFVNYGVIPELAGRLSTHIFLRPLRVEHLQEIMLQQGGIIEEYRQRFEELGVEWGVPDEGVRHLADIALSRRTGARGVEHVCWGVFSQALFDARLAEGPTRVEFAVSDVKARLMRG